MSATAIPTRRPAATGRPPQPRVPYAGLFQEAAYENGQPYALETDEDDDAEDGLPR